MNVYLVENYSELLSREFYHSMSEESHWRVALKTFCLVDEKQLIAEKGVVSNNRFPWIFVNREENGWERLTRFNINFSFNVKQSRDDATYEIKFTGDFLELLKYVYSVDHVPNVLKLKFSATINAVYNRPLTIKNEMTCTTHNTGTPVQFITSSYLHKDMAAIMAYRNYDFESLTIQLIGVNETMSSDVSQICASLQELNERILKEEIHCDFVLVAAGGTFQMACHKSFLAAKYPALKAMFENSYVENQTGRCELIFSKEALKALLDFVYCLKLDIPRENCYVAVELLTFSDEKRMFDLKKALEDMIILKPGDWLDLDAGVKLFRQSTLLGDCQDLKLKAVKTIKRRHSEMENSEPLLKLIKKDSDGTLQLIQCLSLVSGE